MAIIKKYKKLYTYNEQLYTYNEKLTSSNWRTNFERESRVFAHCWPNGNEEQVGRISKRCKCGWKRKIIGSKRVKSTHNQIPTSLMAKTFRNSLGGGRKWGRPREITQR